MKRKAFSLAFIFLLVYSCGIRQEERLFQSAFVGEWAVTSLDCYLNSESPEEQYIVPSSITPKFNFVGRSVSYTVGGNCSVETNGRIILRFSSISDGTIDLVNLLGGSACNQTINEQGGAGSIVVPFEVTSSYSGNLSWSQQASDRVRMQFPSSFKGSNNIGRCNSLCNCVANMQKN